MSLIQGKVHIALGLPNTVSFERLPIGYAGLLACNGAIYAKVDSKTLLCFGNGSSFCVACWESCKDAIPSVVYKIEDIAIHLKAL